MKKLKPVTLIKKGTIYEGGGMKDERKKRDSKETFLREQRDSEKAKVMNIYEQVAMAIRINTLRQAFTRLEGGVVDKEGLIEVLTTYFSTTDSLFNAENFKENCEIIKEDK